MDYSLLLSLFIFLFRLFQIWPLVIMVFIVGPIPSPPLMSFWHVLIILSAPSFFWAPRSRLFSGPLLLPQHHIIGLSSPAPVIRSWEQVGAVHEGRGLASSLAPNSLFSALTGPTVLSLEKGKLFLRLLIMSHMPTYLGLSSQDVLPGW